MFFERLFFVVSRMNEDEPFAKFLLDFFFSTESYHFFDLLSFLTYCLVAFVLGLFFSMVKKNKVHSIGYKFGYFPEVHPDSCQWLPLTEKQKDIVQKLNQASAAFEPVYMTSFYHEHFSSQLTFYDFSRGQGRSLLFYDARFNKVQEAVAIENLQVELLETVDPSGKYAQMVRKAAEDGDDSE